MKRQLTEQEDQIIKDLFDRKAQFKALSAYVTTTEELTLPSGNREIIPSGTTLKIVMISRLNDFGLTPKLDAERGYRIRLNFDSSKITNIRSAA